MELIPRILTRCKVLNLFRPYPCLNLHFLVRGTDYQFQNICGIKKLRKTKQIIHIYLDLAITKAMYANYVEKVKTNKTNLSNAIKQELAFFVLVVVVNMSITS